jgi:thiamine-monophosphate kinase
MAGAWPGEGAIIERYFRHLGAVRTDVVLGIGDDAALVRPRAGSELVLTTDTLVEQVHFLPGSSPGSLGHRALAINLSDLAAMGARPAWALLALTLPEPSEQWLGEFATAFGRLAREHELALVGGNLSRGPLAVTVQLCGQVPAGTALRRSGARVGDELWVSGTLGDAAQGRQLAAPSGADEAAAGTAATSAAAAGEDGRWLRTRFEYPTPRIALGEALRGLATACIDLSDGLLADLPRLAAASECGAELDVERLPLSGALRSQAGASAWKQALAGGEDYELCFAAPPARAPAVAALAARLEIALSCCGRLRREPGLELRRGPAVIQFSQSPFDHFSP